jgi:hypothetical protein
MIKLNVMTLFDVFCAEPPPWYQSPEWWLFIIGVPTLIFIGVQAFASKKAADAALLNSEALIASERPWLVVLPEPVDPDGEELPHLYRLRATNIGNTPAQLFDGGTGCGQQTVDPVFVPAEDDLGPFILPLENLTVHGDYFDIGTIHGKDGEYGMIPKMFHVYGRIRYWDTFSDRTKVVPYVTQWCFMYRWHDRTFHRTPGNYNQNT